MAGQRQPRKNIKSQSSTAARNARAPASQIPVSPKPACPLMGTILGRLYVQCLETRRVHDTRYGWVEVTALGLTLSRRILQCENDALHQIVVPEFD